MTAKILKYAHLLHSIFRLQSWRAWNAVRLGRKFDIEHGTDTQSLIDVVDLGIIGEAALHAVHYEASTLPKIQRVLKHLGVNLSEYSFIDVGSGKGLVVIEAAKHPFNEVIGLEISPHAHKIAEVNIRAASKRTTLRAPIKLNNVNALDYAFPAAKQVIYLYNPFDEPILSELLNKLSRRLTENVEDIVLAYLNPVCKATIEKEFSVDVLHAHRTAMIYRLTRPSKAGAARV